MLSFCVRTRQQHNVVTFFSVRVSQLAVSVLLSTLTSHAGLESYQSQTHLPSQRAQHTCDTCLTLHGSGAELRTPSCCAASSNLARNRGLWSLVNIQSDDEATAIEEAKRLSETVQRLASVGAVRTVTMTNEAARLNKPTVFSGAEEDHSDWEFAPTCFV